MTGASRVLALLAASAVIVLPPGGRVAFAADMTCTVGGDLTFDPSSAALTPEQFGLSFQGAAEGCLSGGGIDQAVATLTGSFSCVTGAGDGTFGLRWPDGSQSLAAMTFTTVEEGVAALGTFQSGPYEGEDVATTLAITDAPVDCRLAQSRTAPADGAVYIYPRPLVVLTGLVDDTALDPAEDAWSVEDQAKGSVDGSIERCAIPGDMYHSENSECKYSQAWVGTKCTRTRTEVTGGSRRETTCEQKQMIQFAYRGGTSNPKSPKISGRCANSTGVPTDTERWHLYLFRLVQSSNGQLRYSAPSSHYAFHVNCDTEGQRFYGTPSPVTMDSDHRAEFIWAHFPCDYTRPCQPGEKGFESSLTFGIGVPS